MGVAAKAELRSKGLVARSAAPAEERSAWSDAIGARVRSHPTYTAARTVHAYVGALAGEVETWSLLTAVLADGKTLVCPRVAAGGTLEHYRVPRPDDLEPGRRGLVEPAPDPDRRVTPASLDLILVPGVVFDRRGVRLGLGGGYYDRFLAESDAHTMGLAFSLQVVPRVPSEAHDRPVDWLVTETETIDCRATRAEEG